MRDEDKELNLYEGMYVLNAHISEDTRHHALEKIKDGIINRGGEILKIHDQGRRRLAYEIKRQREGYYYLMYFTLPTTDVTDLWQEYHLNDNLLRFVTLRTDKVMEEVTFQQLPEQ